MEKSPPKTILIVDDDPDIRTLLMVDFRKTGFRILQAGSGRSAFELILKENVDLVLSDVRMPDGDGIELLERTKKLGPGAPSVILLTGYTELPREEIMARGADAFITKPFDRKALMKTTLRILEERAT